MIKRFTVVSPKGEVIKGENAYKFCEKHKIPYVSFCNLLKGKAHTAGDWRVYKETYGTLENGSINLQILKEKEENYKYKNIIGKSQFYKDGKLIEIENLAKFCYEHNLCQTSMRQLYRGTRFSPYKGYTSGKSKELSDKQSNSQGHKYKLLSPNREIIEISSLRKFALERGFDGNKFYKGIQKEEGWNGWKLLEKKTKYGQSKDFKRMLAEVDALKGEKSAISLV